jgi:serine/threonine-protein kinase
MAKPHADHNLLFGIFARQLDFIGRDQLVAALNVWVLDKHKPLGEILVEQHALGQDTREALELLVDKHQQCHGHQPRQSLAALSVSPDLHRDLGAIADAELQSSLAGLPPPPGTTADLPPTTTNQPGSPQSPLAVGEPSSSGLRFRVVRPYAEGGLGKVSVARDRELNRDVALKEIKPQYADDGPAQARFVAEAEITGGLEHPGVVPVYGLGRFADGRPFYAMRFVHGDSLLEAIEGYHAADWKGRAGERQLALRGLLRRFVDVCNAVAYAHSRGVIHRDLKPANVLLGPYGETLLVDWGLAKALILDEGKAAPPEGFLRPTSGDGVATQAGAVVGTPAYMAPEQARGSGVGTAADVYGLGATLYHLLTGRQPFAGPDVVEVLMRVVQGQCRPAREVSPWVPPALSAVCRRAMALAPEGRYGSAKELAAEVERWLADEPVAAYREPWLPRLARWGRRHRPLVVGAAALLLTAVAALAVGIVAVQREKDRTEGARRATRAALDEMSSQVIEDWLSRRGQLEPAQRAFLEKALAHYEAFAAESGHAEQVRRSVADAHLRVGRIRDRLGQHAEAEVAYRRAQQLCARLAADFPAVPQYRLDLARCHTDLGNLLKDTGRASEAEAAFRTALDVQNPPVADFPAEPQYRRELARTYNSLGALLVITGRNDEGERSYRDAISVQKQLADDFPAEPLYRQPLALLYNNLGILLRNTGRPKEAEAAFRDALDIRARLAADFPAEPRYRHDLAVSQETLGVLLKNAGRAAPAEAAHRAALALLKPLAAEFPAVPQYRQDLAHSYNHLGNLLQDTRRAKEAEAAFRDALAISQQLAAGFPAVPDYRQELALSHNNLGNLLQEAGQLKEAEAAYRAALDIFKRLAADFPGEVSYRLQLGRSLNDLGILLKDTGRAKEAEATNRDALDVQKRLAADHPDEPDYQCDLAKTMVSLAELSRLRKEDAAARRLLEAAGPHADRALQAGPGFPYYREVVRDHRQLLAATLLELGDHASAAQAADDLARVGAEPANDAYKAAACFSRCVRLAEKDTRLSNGRRQELTHAYGEQALAALRQARANGYKDAAHLKTDRDLDPLRQRDDFKKLLAELENEVSKEQPKHNRPKK